MSAQRSETDDEYLNVCSLYTKDMTHLTNNSMILEFQNALKKAISSNIIRQ